MLTLGNMRGGLATWETLPQARGPREGRMCRRETGYVVIL